MKKILPIIAILSLLLASCKGVGEKSDKLQVYTSFYPMYDFARTIGGDDIELYSMVPTGAEPHEFEPTASDVAKLSKADVFIYNGSGMESWTEKISGTLPKNVKIVCASDMEGGVKSDSDPHVWLSIENAKNEMSNICSAFAEADSANAQKYEERFAEYADRLDELKNEYSNAGFEGKKIFVTHGAYGYLCDEFGLEQSALESVTGSGDPSPSQMAQIVDEMKKDGAKCIFYDPLDGDKMASAVAAEAGVEALPLYTFEGDGENRDYITVMKSNLEQLKKAF